MVKRRANIEALIASRITPPQTPKKKRVRKPSASMLRALGIIEEHSGHVYPSMFAKLMWDTTIWAPWSVGKTGGAYLDRLWRMGLVAKGYNELTDAGRRMLSENR